MKYFVVKVVLSAGENSDSNDIEYLVASALNKALKRKDEGVLNVKAESWSSDRVEEDPEVENIILSSELILVEDEDTLTDDEKLPSLLRPQA